MLKYLFIAAMSLYLVSNIVEHIVLDYSISLLCLALVLFSFFGTKNFVKILSLLFLSLGLLLLYIAKVDWPQYILAFGPMLNLLSLFALVPILAIPIRLGNYALRIQQLIQEKVKKSGYLYMITSGISYFLSCCVNLATLPMVYHSIRKSLDLFPIKNRERFMSKAITHGFSMPLVWAPVTPIVGIVIEMNQVSWAAMLPMLIPLSLLGLGLDWLTGLWVASRREKNGANPLAGEWQQTRAEMAVTLQEEITAKEPGKLSHVFIAIFIFILAISSLENFSSFGFMFIVTVLVIPFAFVWSLLIKKANGYVHGLKNHFQTHVPKMREQFVIFLSAGFFISTIKVSGLDHTLNLWVLMFKDVVGLEGFLILLPLLPFALAFTGIHPAVAMALLAEALNPALLGVSPQLLVIALLGGATTSFLMGPYNATLGLMSTIINESTYKISNWNFTFTCLYLLMIMLVLLILQSLSIFSV